MYTLKFHSIPLFAVIIERTFRYYSCRLLHSFILKQDFFPFLFGDQPKLLASGNEKLWGEKDVHKEV